MKRIMILFAFCVSAGLSAQQDSACQFVPTLSLGMRFGCSQDDLPHSVVVTDDGYTFGIEALSGFPSGDLNQVIGWGDVWLIHTNFAGDTLWQNVYGSHNRELGTVLKYLPDGGYLIGMTTRGNDIDAVGNHGAGTTDICIIRTTSDGTRVWSHVYGTEYYECLYEIIPGANDTYCLIGYTSLEDGIHQDAWVVTIDGSGAVLNSVTLCGSGSDLGLAGCLLPNGNYLVAGRTDEDFLGTTPKGSVDVFYVELTPGLDTVSVRRHGGSNSDEITDVTLTGSGAIASIIISNSNDGDIPGDHHGSVDSWVFVTDTAGTPILSKSFGGSGGDWPGSLAAYGQDNLVIWATSNSMDTTGDVPGIQGLYDAWVFGINLSGELLWKKTWGGTGTDGMGDGMQNSFAQVNDTMFVGILSTNSTDGECSIPSRGQTDAIAFVFTVTKDCPEDTTINPTGVSEAVAADVIVFPNPCTDMLSVKTAQMAPVEIWNTCGIHMTKSAAGKDIDVSSYPPGVYIVSVGTYKKRIFKE